jgi:hypothetical protein
MSNTDQNPTSKRRTVADRQWIDSAGAETTDETKATGFRYVLLGDGADKAARVASGVSFVYQIGTEAGNPETMLAIFGGLTKAGNIVNTQMNGEEPVTDSAAIIAGVKSWFDDLDLGKWGEERVGGIGARFDKEKLADALHAVTHKPRDEFVAKLADGAAKIKINAQNKQDPNGKREVLYGTYALYNTAVKAKYNELTGGNEPQASDL